VPAIYGPQEPRPEGLPNGNPPTTKSAERPLSHANASSTDPAGQKRTPELVLDFLSQVSKDSEAQKGLSSLIRAVGLWLIVPSVLCVLALCVLIVAIYITVRSASPLVGAIMAGGSFTTIAAVRFVRRWLKRRAAED
jgi:hypothetical protein